MDSVPPVSIGAQTADAAPRPATIWRRDENGSFSPTAIELGLSDAGHTAIVGGPLSVGDVVAVDVVPAPRNEGLLAKLWPFKGPTVS